MRRVSGPTIASPATPRSHPLAISPWSSPSYFLCLANPSAPAGRTEGASPRVEQLVGAAGQAGGGGAGDGGARHAGARCGGGVGSIRGTDAAAQVAAAEVAAAQVAVREQVSCTVRSGGGRYFAPSPVPHVRSYLVPPVKCGPSPLAPCPVPPVRSYLVPPVRRGPSPLAPCPVPPVRSKLVPPVRRGPSPLTPNRRNPLQTGRLASP